MAAAVTLMARDGDTLDELAWRDAGMGPETLPAFLTANPRLCEQLVLTAGTTVIVPPQLITAPAAVPTRKMTNLWD